MIKENLYKILGLPDFASIDEIKKAYRALAMKHHPDKGGDVERMKNINVAYQILSEKKQNYDARLRGGFQPNIIIRHQAYGWQDATTGNTNTFTWTFYN